MLTSILLAAAPALAPPLPAPRSATPAFVAETQDGSSDGERSLEEFLREARSKKEAQLSKLRGPVAAIVVRLESLRRPRPAKELRKLRADLDALGREAAALLLPHIDPGEPSSDESRFRAEEVAEALIRMRTAVITEPLIELGTTANMRTRHLAIRVLGHAPDHRRASAFLTTLFAKSDGTVRHECVLALAHLGGPENAEVLKGALQDSNEEIVRAVLGALAVAKDAAAAEGVRALLRNHASARQCVTGILGYFRACPDTVDGDVVVELLELASANPSRLSEEDQIRVLDAIPEFDPDLGSRVTDAIAPLLASSDPDIQEAAQVCVALLGDRGARRELKKKYDEWIREQDNWAAAYEKRGALLVKLEEYADAAKDYKRAIEMREEGGRPVPRDLYIEMARAHVLGDKLRQGYEALRVAYLSPGQLDEVAADPDFAELVSHSRYGKLFE